MSSLALALWLGGLVALGAFAAPEVFRLEREVAGQTMGSIFRKFDYLALVAIGAFAAAELVRAVLDGVGGTIAKVRVAAAGVVVACVLVSAAWLGPRINDAFAQGVRRGVGEAGARMDRDHELAELAGKIGVFAGAGWFALSAASRRKQHV